MNTGRLQGWLTLGANVGVLIGLGLLIYEIRQNTELVSAEIHSIRAEGKANRQMDLANNGQIAEILEDLFANGFPGDPDAMSKLSFADSLRIRLMYTAVLEAMSNWQVQCDYGLLIEETCAISQRAVIADMVPMAKAAGVALEFASPSFIAEVQSVMREKDMPVPNDDGSWPE